MKEDIAKAWIADLRANPETQGHHLMLTEEGKMCCLGRLTFVVMDKPREWAKGVDGEDCRYSPSAIVREEAGLRPRHDDEKGVGTLMRMNDEEGKNFHDIADWIEEHWPEL